MSDTTTDAEFLDWREAAVLLRMAPQSIRNLTSTRKIPFLKIGGKVLFVRDDLRAWAMSHKVPAIGEVQ
ncbi:MAG: helix-turn-helix domain-containing protein [Rectinemataceae bacterium]